MVMEIPTPQCVGREFVRQYYTLLNKAPLHLHRFYNHDSSFLHGGMDRPGQETRPVVGQQDIHERIMQLNFRDCHAKIRQVDSLETLGDGVVVQVSGELSNNGQPMRRFMQTFVLVPQSPKKYYVRNDIFRYQDELFTEDDNDLDVDESVTRNSRLLDQDDNVGYHEDIVRNGSAYSNDSVVVSAKSDWEYKEEEEDPKEEGELEEEMIGERDHLMEECSSGETRDASPPPSVSQERPRFRRRPPPSPPQLRPGHGPRDSYDSVAGSPMEVDSDAERGGIGGEAFVDHPYDQQLFVGNITHSITEEELKVHFTQFGRVLDVHINIKHTQRKGKVPKNYGFIVFEEAKSVQKVLASRPIYFNNHRLNVVKKKRPKDNPMMPPASPRGGPLSQSRYCVGPRGGPRRGMRGAYTPSR